MREEIKNWIRQAEADLDTARCLLKNGKYSHASFLAQQSAEKALKALLLDKGMKLIKTHDLVLLSRKLNLPDKIIDLCKELTPVYIETRYPGVDGWREFSRLESEKDIKTAGEILEWIKKNL